MSPDQDQDLMLFQEKLASRLPVLFSALGRSLVKVKPSAWIEQLQEVGNAIPDESWSDKARGQAFALFWRGMARAMFELVREGSNWLFCPSPEEADRLAVKVCSGFCPQAFPYTSIFLENPPAPGLVRAVGEIFGHWLSKLGLSAARAASAQNRFSPYLSWAIDREYLENHQDYTSLSGRLGPPFDRKDGMDLAWRANGSWTKKNAFAPYYGEDTFGLAQIYLPFMAFRATRALNEAPGSESLSSPGLGPAKSEKSVVDPEKEILAWLKRADSRDTLRLVTSEAGAGQNHFALMLAVRLAQSSSCRPFWAPFQHFQFTGNIEEDLASFFIRTRRSPVSPLETASTDRPVFIIFGDLDYLSLDNLGTQKAAGIFFQALLDFLKEKNKNGTRFLALVTGWRPLIDGLWGKIPQETEIFDLIPYWFDQEQIQGLADPAGLLEPDQRDQWWRTFGELTGQDYSGLPQGIKNQGERFDRLTGLPIMNYFLARTLESGYLTIDSETTINELIFDYLHRIHDQVSDERRAHHWLHKIDFKDFRNVLKEISILLWHHQERRLVVSRHLEHFEKLGLTGPFTALSEIAASGALPFLFDSRVADSSGTPDQAHNLGFQHLGLSSYLTSRRIYNELTVLDQELEKRKEFPFLGIDERFALARWFDLCSLTEMNPGIFGFLLNQIRLAPQEGAADRLQEMVLGLLGQALTSLSPIGFFFKGDNLWQARDMVRNGIEALMAVHSACARITTRPGRIPFKDEHGPARLFRFLLAPRTPAFTPLAARCLNHLDISPAVLDGLDLREANLSSSNLTRASLHHVLLINADLQQANLNEARLRFGRLAKADLRRALLRRADARQADLTGADLRETDLGKADLTEACLRGADLRWADLRGGIFKKADLREADLRWSYLHGADLTGADLTGADTRESGLDQTEL